MKRGISAIIAIMFVVSMFAGAVTPAVAGPTSYDGGDSFSYKKDSNSNYNNVVAAKGSRGFSSGSKGFSSGSKSYKSGSSSSKSSSTKKMTAAEKQKAKQTKIDAQKQKAADRKKKADAKAAKKQKKAEQKAEKKRQIEEKRESVRQNYNHQMTNSRYINNNYYMGSMYGGMGDFMCQYMMWSLLLGNNHEQAPAQTTVIVVDGNATETVTA